jgi:flagellar hook-associated protein 2
MSSSSGALQSISGLASGIDTTSIVSALMSIAKQPQIHIQNQITVEQARQSAYQAVLNELNDLTTSYQALTDVSTWASTQSVSSSNSSVFTATMTGGAAAGSYSVTVQNLARANQWTSSGNTTAAAADTIHLTTGAGTTDIAVDAGDSLDTIASKINSTTGAPVYATMFNGSLVLSNKQTGTVDSNGNAIAVTVTTDGGSGINFAQTQTAQDANFTFGGTSYTRNSNVVTDVVPGVTLTLTGQSSQNETLTIGGLQPNTTDITNKLNAFVSKYNSTIEDIMSRLQEQPVPNAQTDADRAKGVLYGDSSLQRLLSQLRNAFSDTITSLTTPASPYTSLAQVGLSTGAAVGTGALNSDSIDGKMTVDTTAFQNALNTNYDQVKALFTNFTGSYSTEGLGQRLNDILTPFTESSLLGGYLGTEIDGETSTIQELQAQSADWDTRLALKQQTLQAQFVAMEEALSKTQSVSSSLTQSINQLGTSG